MTLHLLYSQVIVASATIGLLKFCLPKWAAVLCR